MEGVPVDVLNNPHRAPAVGLARWWVLVKGSPRPRGPARLREKQKAAAPRVNRVFLRGACRECAL